MSNDWILEEEYLRGALEEAFRPLEARMNEEDTVKPPGWEVTMNFERNGVRMEFICFGSGRVWIEYRVKDGPFRLVPLSGGYYTLREDGPLKTGAMHTTVGGIGSELKRLAMELRLEGLI
jgi:hypothetical protein